MISRDEILMGRDVEYPLTEELETNLTTLMIAANKLRDLYGKPMFVSSGYRPGRFNTAAGGAKNSSHEWCEAIDFHDRDSALKNWITSEILEQCGLYMENAGATLSWLHIQIRRPLSGSRVFFP